MIDTKLVPLTRYGTDITYSVANDSVKKNISLDCRYGAYEEQMLRITLPRLYSLVTYDDFVKEYTDTICVHISTPRSSRELRPLLSRRIDTHSTTTYVYYKNMNYISGSDEHHIYSYENDRYENKLIKTCLDLDHDEPSICDITRYLYSHSDDILTTSLSDIANIVDYERRCCSYMNIGPIRSANEFMFDEYMSGTVCNDIESIHSLLDLSDKYIKALYDKIVHATCCYPYTEWYVELVVQNNIVEQNTYGAKHGYKLIYDEFNDYKMINNLCRDMQNIIQGLIRDNLNMLDIVGVKIMRTRSEYICISFENRNGVVVTKSISIPSYICLRLL